MYAYVKSNNSIEFFQLKHRIVRFNIFKENKKTAYSLNGT